MKIFSPLWLCLVALPFTLLGADDIVAVGSGSYTTRAPENTRQPPAEIYRSAGLKGPMPTNRWWSSLAWVPLSDAMFPHPLAVRAVAGGLQVAYPGAHITASSAAIMGVMPAGGEDFIIGNAGQDKFSEARVDGFSDWFVTALFQEGANQMRATFGHGSPFVYVTLNGNPTLTFKTKPKIWSGSEKEAVLGISVGDRHYGIFAPTGSTWFGLESNRWIADPHGKTWFAVAVLPDDKAETLAQFRKYAYTHVTDSRVAWSYDEKRCVVQTTFTFTTKAYEGADNGTLFALYPHQWTHTQAKLLPLEYQSVRGPMKVSEGKSFATEMVYPGVLPSLPITSSVDSEKLTSFLKTDADQPAKRVGDTYWLGKQLGRWATLIPIAEQAGDKAAVEACTENLRGALENFFTATTSQGTLKKGGDGLFYYDANWGTLIGYPASYGSDDQLNDHHFHYGYFIRAAGELARRDPAWASDAKWGGMVKLVTRDIACPDHGDARFPFLRNFDCYAGHSWASGHAKFADGNNNESSSEAINAWYGLILFSEATGDRALRDLGVWLLTMEVEAIDDYWFDVENRFRPKEYPASVVTMVWGGKGANGTWFSGEPEAIHGINWLPVTGASLYLGRYPEYCAKNYTALLSEKQTKDAEKAAKAGAATPGSSEKTNWHSWPDIIWMYRALSDPADATAQFEARSPSFKPEAGNSLANTYLWLTTFAALGQIDRSVTADAPFYAVFNKAGKRTHVAWNVGDKPRVVAFSDGVLVTCQPHAMALL